MNTNSLVPVKTEEELKAENKKLLKKMTKAQLIEQFEEQQRMRLALQKENAELCEQVLEMRAVVSKYMSDKEYTEGRNREREKKMEGWMTL